MYFNFIKCGSEPLPTKGKSILVILIIMVFAFIMWATIVDKTLIRYGQAYISGKSIDQLMMIRSDRPDDEMMKTRAMDKHHISFVDTMKTFPWASYQSAVESKETPEIQRFSSELLNKLVPFLIQSPTKPINRSCVAPAYQVPKSTGNLPPCNPKSPTTAKRKVGILWQLGLDADGLEIHLHELDGLVDKFFILESIHAHNSFVPKKQLLWEQLKYDERFAMFSDKIVHFLVDDSDLVKADPSNIWSRESQQERLRWDKFLEWNKATNYFGQDDLLGFGDVDEIPNRDIVNFLKSCDFDMGLDSIDVGLWFPFDGPNTVFASDFPVLGLRYTYGDPTFWKLSSALKYFKKFKKHPTRRRNASRWSIVGGLHFSRYAYPPMQLVKLLTATESQTRHLELVLKVGTCYADGKVEEAENLLNSLDGWGGVRNRIVDLEDYRRKSKKDAENIVRIPWFLQCNRERYPGFDKKHDPRLDE